MQSRILLVGGGGREHALAWKLLDSPLCGHLVVAPGNPGIEDLAGTPRAAGRLRVAAVASDDQAGLVALAETERIDLVVCGPEAPLAAGLGDAFLARGLRFFGPTRAAAEIESSKAYAKALMKRAGVPSAAHASFDEVADALAYIDAQPGNVVVKADGLCAGKGVVVASSAEEARAAVREILGRRKFGDAGGRVVIEERLEGAEVSMLAFCDGERFALLDSAEDHKAVLDGDSGPNTGGMGAYSPSPLMDAQLTAQIAATIFAPTVRALADAGRPFRGLLYGGLMLTARGPMVIEWNCRFGDPETQAILLRMDEDIVPWLLGAAEGRLPGDRIRFRPGTSLCVVLAAHGYPEKVRTGDVITGIEAAAASTPPGGGPAVEVFHAGTRRSADELITAGGRVLGVSAAGADLGQARARAYAAIEHIAFSGMHFRRDIGLRTRTAKKVMT
jgi:phosphoribosylamine---glycine ligase